MANHIKYYFIIVLGCLPMLLSAQMNCTFRHYSYNEGLTQSSITDITSDRHGGIWLGTFDGLVKYDGYEFKSFKVLSENHLISKSNRVDNISEDYFGRFWLRSLGDAYCFNPVDESYWSIKQLDEFKALNLYISNVDINRSKKVWLIIPEHGCVCVTDSLFNYKSYLKSNGKFKANQINSIYEDKSLNTWLLTDNGLHFIAKNNPDEVQYMFENQTDNPANNQSFHSAYETETEIWFGSGNGQLWRYSKVSRTFREEKLNNSSIIRRLFTLNSETLIALTTDNGFFTYQLKTGEKEHFNSDKITGIDEDVLNVVHVERPNHLWLTTSANGIFRYNLATNKIKKYEVTVDKQTVTSNKPLPFILKDKKGQLWVHPNGGGFSLYNKEKDQLEPFFNAPNAPNRKFSNIIQQAIFDQQGNLWMCTRYKGLEKVIFNTNDFQVIKPESMPLNASANNVRAIHQDAKGQIWMATKENKILLYDETFKLHGNISPQGKLVKNAIWTKACYTIAEDKWHNIWLGTRGDGIYVLTPTSKPYNYDVKHFTHNENDALSLSNNHIYAINQDNEGNIWIGTFGGGLNLAFPNGNKSFEFINANNRLKNFPIEICNRVRSIASSSNGIVYAGTSSGLLAWKANFSSPEEVEFKHYSRSDSLAKSISNNEIMDIHISKQNQIYLATFGGGLVTIDANNSFGFPTEFTAYRLKQGLPSEVILALQSDSNGKIWLTTENDLVCFNAKTKSFESFTELDQILAGNVFSESTATQLQSGQLVFGTFDGVVRFNPDNIRTNKFTPYIKLSNFKVYNRGSNSQNDTIYKNIDQISKIELNHNQNFFSIEFSAIEYNNTQNVLYAYMLEGFDKNWKHTKKQRTANYTNIPPGKYKFRVQSTNGHGVKVNNERVVAITIHPSFWNTPFAYALYVVGVIVLFLMIQRYILILFKLKNDIRLQKKMSDMKLKFFTDISHEIRTPLTMITAPVEYMINDPRTPDDAKKQLSFIAQSTERLLKLVNQILDYRKVQVQSLAVTQTDLGQFTRKICLDFEEVAEEKSIKFVFDKISDNTVIWANQDDLEKILMNLLSNAFKYNKSGNQIEVIVESNEYTSVLTVLDNGPGIPLAKQKELFNRFASFNDDSSNPSTGIGLSIVKEIADKHNATLTVESEEGQGSSFTVEFKNGYEHFNENVIIKHPEKQIQEKKATTEEEDVIAESTSEKDAKKELYSVLLVEDDEKLRSFMKSILEDDYTIYEAGDGKEGFSKAVSKSPDFIVSDVMMPKKNGIDLLKALRNDSATSHIPIILLTAKTNIESKLEGLTYGADDYITKPFSVAYFKARIQNLIKQRKLLQAIYASNMSTTGELPNRPNFVTNNDEKFIEKVVDLIGLNLERNDFTVEELGSLVGMSRTTLFNKLKSLTGMSPVEFIRDYRMKKAAQLIAEKDLLIKEVCYLIGFSDQKYFGKCFKEKYGMTPMAYRTQSRTKRNEVKNQIFN